ncbi:MAG: glycosyltransferase family 9 protein [Planctomycetota bacterium]
MRILILKTGALGDVLRTTSILSGLHARHPGCRVSWLVAEGAEDLVRHHPLVAAVHSVRPEDPSSVAAAGQKLGAEAWDRVLSFDDEVPLCALASRLSGGGDPAILSGAYLDAEGRPAYTPDTAPWFDMGLLSRFGKAEADRRKAANRESHPALFARMLGIAPGEPALPIPAAALRRAAAWMARAGLEAAGAVVGLNTGAGGRWDAKRLPVGRTIALAERIARDSSAAVAFVVLGGPEEAARQAEILRGLAGRVRAVDGGTENSLLDFAARIDRLDLLVTSDSLALHVAIARRVKVLAFFAPTSAAEIELYGRGEKVASTAPDSCSYRPDADTSTLTVERLAPPALRLLAGG